MPSPEKFRKTLDEFDVKRRLSTKCIKPQALVSRSGICWRLRCNMEWFNAFGLVFIAVIMIPNTVFAVKCKDGFDNKWNNKYVSIIEQAGRFGCFGFMIINIPGTSFGWIFDGAFYLYLIADAALVLLYCAVWIICFRKNTVFRALALSFIPSLLFLFSGVMTRSVLLIISSLLFAPSHILISCKNAKQNP